MELLISRKNPDGDAILGDLYVDAAHECFTLERLGVQIPIGRYRVTITPSIRFGRLLPLVNDVPGRSGIRLHPLNFPQQSEGCIGVGQEATVTSIQHSILAMQALQPQIAGALARGEDVFLTIVNATEGHPK